MTLSRQPQLPSLGVLVGVLLLLGLAAVLEPGHAKVFERCELARELFHLHNIPAGHVATWVCIARYESEYNSTAVGHMGGDGSGDHGLFQVSDLYWCSRPGRARGRGKACGLSCAELEDDDIADDVSCVKKIYREHKGLSGDGFNAWAVYPLYCRSKKRALRFLEGCFDGSVLQSLKEASFTGPVDPLEEQQAYQLPPPRPKIAWRWKPWNIFPFSN